MTKKLFYSKKCATEKNKDRNKNTPSLCVSRFLWILVTFLSSSKCDYPSSSSFFQSRNR